MEKQKREKQDKQRGKKNDQPDTQLEGRIQKAAGHRPRRRVSFTF